MGFMNSNMLPEFSRELRELPWQPNLGRKAKIAQISIPCKKSRNFKHVNTGLLNSNMLPEFYTEPRELPWQPNLGKNKPKMHKTSCLDRIVRRRNVVNGSEDVFL